MSRLAPGGSAQMLGVLTGTERTLQYATMLIDQLIIL